jgi:hypothetical protein
MTYTPFTGCIVCSEFDPADPFEENDVVPFVDCEEYTVTDPYASCSDVVVFKDVSSTPYPILCIEEISSNGSIISAGRLYVALLSLKEEELSSTGALITGGTLGVITVYINMPNEEIISSSAIITAGTLDIITVYATIETDSLESSGSLITSGTLDTIVIYYSYWPAESLESSGALITGGTLT